MLPVLGVGVISVVGDGGAGEVEGTTVGGGNYFYGVGVGDVRGGAADFEGGDFDVWTGEGTEKGGEVFGFEEGFVALDVDVDVGVDVLGDGVDAVGAAGEIGRGEMEGPIVGAAEVGYFFGVGGDEDAGELGAGTGGVVNPCKHWASGDGAEDFAGEARGCETCRDDAEDGGRLLFERAGIKYDGNWLCRGDSPLLA